MANVHNHCGLRFFYYYKRLENFFAMRLCKDISYKKHPQENMSTISLPLTLRKVENKKLNDSPTHMWQRHGTGLQHCKNIIASTTMTYVVRSVFISSRKRKSLPNSSLSNGHSFFLETCSSLPPGVSCNECYSLIILTLSPSHNLNMD